MKTADIDIDVADRELALEGQGFVTASLIEGGDLRRHPTGVFYQRIPIDPVSGLSAFPNGRDEGDVAGQLGFWKLDILPNHAYALVKSPEHRDRLLAMEPDWSLFAREDVVKRLYQLGNSYDICRRYPPRSIEDLACIIALIRPGKRKLVGAMWQEITRKIWDREKDGYVFKKSHAVAFAMCIVVRLNSMVEAGEI